MDNFKTITLDGKRYKLIPDKQEEKQERKTGWERAGEENSYFYLSNSLLPSFDVENRFDNGEQFYECGNYRNNEELNKNICRAMRLRLKMLQWQALNDEPVKIHNDETIKWYIYWNEELELLQITRDNDSGLDVVYFSSREKVEEALRVFYDELLWYYTEFYRRLDEKR